MTLLRNISRIVASNGFRLSILLLAIACTALALVGSPQSVKKTLDKSDVYPVLADSIVQHASKTGQNSHRDGQGAADDTTLTQPEVKSAAKQALTPAFVQASTEQVIDGTYHWLDGKVAKPDFSIDLQPTIAAFEDKAADAAIARIQGLPTCSLVQLRSLNVSEINPFQIPCRPPGINLQAERQKYIDSIAANSDNEFIKNPVITIDRLEATGSGQSVFDKASAVPASFTWLKRSPFIFGGLAILLAPAVVFLHRDRRRGIRSLGVSLLITGVVLLAISLLARWLFGHFLTSDTGPLHLSQQSDFEQVAMRLADSLEQTAGKVLLIFGIVYGILGAGILIALHFVRHQEAKRDKQGTILDDKHESGPNQLDSIVEDTHAERAATERPRPVPVQRFTDVKKPAKATASDDSQDTMDDDTPAAPHTSAPRSSSNSTAKQSPKIQG